MAYADLTDLDLSGIPPTAFGQATDADKQRALDDASGEMDSRFNGRYALPLRAWDASVRKNCVKIAVWNLLKRRGYNPASGADTVIRMDYDDAMAWLGRVQRQAEHPVVVESVNDAIHLQPTVLSSSVIGLGNGCTARNRGW